MSRNPVGMFGMINRAVQNSPLGTGAGQQMLDIASQGAGNLMSQVPGVTMDPMAMMTPGAQATQAQQDLSQLDLTTSEGLLKAAQLYQKMGDTESALKLADKARQLSEVKNARDKAVLEEGQAEVASEVERKKGQAARAKTAAYAVKSGDADLADQIRSGDLSADAYMKHSMKKKDLYELSQGEALVDADGNLIRLNPDLTPSRGNTGYEPSVSDVKLWNAGSLKAEENRRLANQSEALIGQVDGLDMSAGLYNTVEEWALAQLGQRDKPQFLRTEAMRIVNHEVMQSLPPGPASDKDVAIAQSGFPSKNASKEEFVRFLGATSRLAKKAAVYEDMKAQYIIEGRAKDFKADWKAKMLAVGQKEAKAEVPDAAILWLRYNDSPENRDAFRLKYGVSPESML